MLQPSAENGVLSAGNWSGKSLFKGLPFSKNLYGK
jgi:hypothetical protein